MLWLIALLLSVSGAIRLSGETGQAIAREVTQIANSRLAPTVGESMGLGSQACAAESDITEVLIRLQERETLLEARENALIDRMQALAVAEIKVEESLKALIAAESELKATMAFAETAAEDDLTRLTTVYENMKAKEAAALFGAMDPQFAAGFLGRMRPDAAALIMAGLDPQVAYTISVVLAGRNANVPTN
ncbi:MAG: hypothetical protein GY945_03920 [Rhodobacteraceae bacterium]|nr:hypothetical protein [Paracoccaceae bacterium]